MEFSSQCDIINKHNQSTELYNYDIIIISYNDLAPIPVDIDRVLVFVL